MKTVYTVLVVILTIQFANGQNRIAEKVSFPGGDETITGILVKPNNGDHLPAVVFQQGSGPHSFDGYEAQACGPHGFYIEDVLLEQGYAVLYCNKRGLGKSTGNWKKNSFQGRADDAYAAVTYLKTLPFIDPNRIGISGHSQGGWIAQIVAAQHSDIAFVIAIAGPAVSVKAQTGSNDSLRYMCEGYSGEKLSKKMKKDRKHKNWAITWAKNSPLLGVLDFGT